MELWMKIGSAVLLGAMVIFLFPRAKHMLENSPKAESGDWQIFIILIAAVGLFVWLLIKLV